ncbi:hypothetical protein FH972_022890 [Carpinus fangiana]|uniref:Vacuolar protein 14 C-terminal Fig4-binding domain-containing protein n=1 Tax=Carpinus fangiana TaxID=176857 RepID=A0A5N6KVT6_9ROSI|nr:hypothetical protein FH972_022890 [Carpinus fangiana]
MFLKDASEEHVQLTALRWVDSFFEICPEEILPHVPPLLNQVLPALSSDIEQVRQAATRVNGSLMDYIVSLPDEEEPAYSEKQDTANQSGLRKDSAVPRDRRDSGTTPKPPAAPSDGNNLEFMSTPPRAATPQQPPDAPDLTIQHSTVDYEASVNALTLQFLNENEATRIAALSWLIMLQRKAPKQVLAAHDGTFPALLKTLSDTSDTVVTRDLQLLSQISKHSDDDYFTFFMVNLLKLFCTDRRLLESRGNLIIRQLCNNLSPERIYRTMADCLEKDEDVEFASIMVQNLNNNLITAPELADMRKRLRNWESRDGQTLFVALFKAWCHNAVATISLCLLAQAYEQAYNLLQIFADIEVTVDILIQVDKLVQLLESPVFTFLRLQLLEPERYPYLYKCLYGILMLLPQSAAFAALKNRLNSVSAIGYLHIPSSTRNPPTTPVAPAFDRSNRLKSREDGPVKWSELLEKFRNVQDKARRVHGRSHIHSGDEDRGGPSHALTSAAHNAVGARKLPNPNDIGAGARNARLTPTDQTKLLGPGAASAPKPEAGHKSRFSASHLGKTFSGKGRSKK